MTEASTTLARLACDEATARRLADVLGDSLDPQDSACAAFEAGDGRWRLEIYFRNAPDEAEVAALVATTAGAAAAAKLEFAAVAAADWVAQSLAGLTPVAAGRFLVHGAHDRARVGANRIGIEIEAALAFGTGHHGTTRGCLMALDDLAKRRRPRRVLDVGTGSGVLAIAAARALRAPVTAFDIDPLAVAAGRANARLNRAGAFVVCLRGNGPRAGAVRRHAPYDLIFANILLGPLQRMAVNLAALICRGGTVVLSGLLPAHANAALSIYAAQGFALERRITLDGWTTLVLRRSRPFRQTANPRDAAPDRRAGARGR
jgi:ribosomal protein L11 methyltransferase